jgi:hypothetical protein
VLVTGLSDVEREAMVRLVPVNLHTDDALSVRERAFEAGLACARESPAVTGEMVERVAMAIAHDDAKTETCDPWEKMHHDEQDEYRSNARAALGAAGLRQCSAAHDVQVLVQVPEVEKVDYPTRPGTVRPAQSSTAPDRDEHMRVSLSRCSECGRVSSSKAWDAAWWDERSRRMADPEMREEWGTETTCTYGLDDHMVCPRCKYVHSDDENSWVEEVEGVAVLAECPQQSKGRSRE